MTETPCSCWIETERRLELSRDTVLSGGREKALRTLQKREKMDEEMAAGVHLVFETIVWLVEDYDLLLLTASFSDSLRLKSSK